MGLDVYLYRFTEPISEFKGRRRSFTEAEDGLLSTFFKKAGVSKRRDLPLGMKAELDDQLTALREEYVVDEYGNPLEDSRIEITEDSELYPDHMFKIGYWRSSYNSGGLNQALQRRIGRDLYDVFEKESDYYVEVDWETVLPKAKALLDDFKKDIETKGDFNVMKMEYNPFKNIEEEDVTNEKIALEVFAEEQKRQANSIHGGPYMNHRGHFFLQEGVTVHGFIEGRSEMTGDPMTYVVYKNEVAEGDETSFDWYIHALEIVVETIEYVLKQDDPSRYALAWSA